MGINISMLSRQELEELQDQIQARLMDFNEKDFEVRAKAILDDLIQLAKDYPASAITFQSDCFDEPIDFLSTSHDYYDYCY